MKDLFDTFSKLPRSSFYLNWFKSYAKFKVVIFGLYNAYIAFVFNSGWQKVADWLKERKKKERKKREKEGMQGMREKVCFSLSQRKVIAPKVRKGRAEQRCKERKEENNSLECKAMEEREREIHTKPSKQNIKQDNFYSRPKIL